eukprot:TRINITY_DN65804_c0_g1_i1.p1 TRINITY_DN65804_c0_g1~~TRINITY_DN65804_c0_g1_i1.p1  ORF type:complete len:330 (+),score=60.37 TRINITY_DN65804_c0_g1_i1:98-1087(+)
MSSAKGHPPRNQGSGKSKGTSWIRKSAANDVEDFQDKNYNDPHQPPPQPRLHGKRCYATERFCANQNAPNPMYYSDEVPPPPPLKPPPPSKPPPPPAYPPPPPHPSLNNLGYHSNKSFLEFQDAYEARDYSDYSTLYGETYYGDEKSAQIQKHVDSQECDGDNSTSSGSNRDNSTSSGSNPQQSDASQKSSSTHKRVVNTRRATHRKGKHCKVQKHSSFGCAIVTLPTMGLRELLLASLTGQERESDGATLFHVDGVVTTIKRHFDKETSKDVVTDVFVGWGRQTELATPLSAERIAAAIDKRIDGVLKCFEIHEASPPPQVMPTPSFQ